MDVTRSLNVNLATNFAQHTYKYVENLPAGGEKTVRFNADDACMDVTRSHTVKIVSDLQLQPQPNLDFLPACGEKTVRFNADDACMDVTRSHTAKIDTNIQPHEGRIRARSILTHQTQIYSYGRSIYACHIRLNLLFMPSLVVHSP